MANRNPAPLNQAGRTSPTGHPWLALFYSVVVGLAGLSILGYRLVTAPQLPSWPSILLFVILSFLVQRSSFHLGSPIVHSLAGVIDLAAVFALGPAGGAAVAAWSGLTYLELNALRHRRLTRRHLIEVPLFNAGLKASMALLGGWLFAVLNGRLPVGGATGANGQTALALATVCLLWFTLDHVGWGFFDYLDGGLSRLRTFVQDAIPTALLIELLPLPLSLVVALAYTELGGLPFVLLALAIVAVALLTQRWADTRTALTQRVAELTTIEQVGRAIVQAQWDIDELCQLMYEHARRIVDTTIFHLGFFEGDDYDIRLWVREGQPEPRRSFRLAPGVGLVNWLRESKQPILVRDFERELESLPAQPAYVSERPPHSALFVPLIAGETVIGTMSIQSFQRSAYGESDLRVLSAMANQAAVAIQKAQLYNQERRRARQLETISQVSRQVTATLELDELFERIVHLVRENFGYYHIAIFTADPERQVVNFEASASAGTHDVAFDVAWGEGLIGWVAAHGEAVIVNDVETDTRYRCVEALEETLSEMSVPLLLEDRLVGVLDVQSREANAFGDDDLFILETLGDQIAIAIQEAQLYEAERQQAWLSTALLQVAESMSYVADIDAVLTTIVRLTPILAGVDRCAILLWDTDLESFVPAQTHGLRPELRSAYENTWFAPEAIPAIARLCSEKVPVVVQAEDEAGLIPPELAETFDIQEMALLPLLAQGELLGVMMVDYAGQPHHFSERTVEMLTGIANQAAMVIQSARLLQAQQEEAYVSMALVQVAEAVSRAADLEEALETLVRITPLLAGVEACTVFLWDLSADAFLPYRDYGLEGKDQRAFWGLRFPGDHPLTQALRQDVAFVPLGETSETEASAQILGEGSVLAFPLVSKGELLGMMTVDYTGPAQRISQRWLDILTGIAGQAAIAIENDRLLQEAAEQQRLRQELDVARRIQTSFLPECCPHVPGWELATVWRAARQVSGDFYDFIPLPADGGSDGPGRTGVVIADVADKGVPAALFMALSRTLVRTMAIDGRPPATAVAQANNLILADARSTLFVTLFYAILQPNSGEVRFVNAGHMPPLLVRAANGTAEELRRDGMALGVLPDVEFDEHYVNLDPGDLLILYTDGVVEASDAEGEMFGRERFRELVSAHWQQTAEELAQTIEHVIGDFVGNAPRFDDFTLVAVRRSPT